MCTDCYKNASKEIQKYCRNVLCPVSEIDLHCQNKVNWAFFSFDEKKQESILSSYVFRKRKSHMLFAIPSNVVYQMEIIRLVFVDNVMNDDILIRIMFIKKH